MNVSKTEIASALTILLAACQQEDTTNMEREMLALLKENGIETTAKLEDSLASDEHRKMLDLLSDAEVADCDDLSKVLEVNTEVDHIIARSSTVCDVDDIASTIREVDRLDCSLDEVNEKLEELDECGGLGRFETAKEQVKFHDDLSPEYDADVYQSAMNVYLELQSMFDTNADGILEKVKALNSGDDLTKTRAYIQRNNMDDDTAYSTLKAYDAIANIVNG